MCDVYAQCFAVIAHIVGNSLVMWLLHHQDTATEYIFFLNQSTVLTRVSLAPQVFECWWTLERSYTSHGAKRPTSDTETPWWRLTPGLRWPTVTAWWNIKFSCTTCRPSGPYGLTKASRTLTTADESSSWWVKRVREIWFPMTKPCSCVCCVLFPPSLCVLTVGFPVTASE